MTDQVTKEQLIRVKILPQLESLSDRLWDTGQGRSAFGQKMDKIIKELNTILNQEDN